MGVHGRCGGLLLDDAPLEGQELFALELNARADSPSGIPLAASGLLTDRRAREDVQKVRERDDTAKKEEPERIRNLRSMICTNPSWMTGLPDNSDEYEKRYNQDMLHNHQEAGSFGALEEGTRMPTVQPGWAKGSIHGYDVAVENNKQRGHTTNNVNYKPGGADKLKPGEWNLDQIVKVLSEKILNNTSRSKDQLRQAYRLIRCGQAINPQVLKQRITDMNIPITDAQTLQLFELLDDDNSGELTGWEFVVGLLPKDYTGELWMNASEAATREKAAAYKKAHHELGYLINCQEKTPASLANPQWEMSELQVENALLDKFTSITQADDKMMQQSYFLMGKEPFDGPRLQEYLRCRGLVLSDAQIDQLFLKIDADGSGEIDVYELLDFLTKQVHIKGWCNKNANWGAPNNGTNAACTRAEVAARLGIRNKWPKHLASWAPSVAQVIEQIQTKLDQKVSASGQSSGEQRKWMVFDPERRGCLNKRQFEDGCNRINVSCPTEMLQQVFHVLDTDKNGIITRAEFAPLFTIGPQRLGYQELPGTVRDLAKLNDWEPMEEPSSDPAGDELLQMKKSAAATSRPDGLPPRGMTPRDSSVANGLRREAVEATTLSWTPAYQNVRQDGEAVAMRNPESKHRRTASHRLEQATEPNELVADWPKHLVQGSWRWTPAELLRRIADKALGKTAQWGQCSRLQEVFRKFGLAEVDDDSGNKGRACGCLSKRAFLTAVHRLGIEITKEFVDLVYDKYDGDDDGLLSRDELRDALFPDDRPDPVPTGKPNPPKLQTMHKQSAAVSPVPTPQPPGNGRQVGDPLSWHEDRLKEDCMVALFREVKESTETGVIGRAEAALGRARSSISRCSSARSARPMTARSTVRSPEKSSNDVHRTRPGSARPTTARSTVRSPEKSSNDVHRTRPGSARPMTARSIASVSSTGSVALSMASQALSGAKAALTPRSPTKPPSRRSPESSRRKSVRPSSSHASAGKTCKDSKRAGLYVDGTPRIRRFAGTASC